MSVSTLVPWSVVSVTGPVIHGFSESNWQQNTEQFYEELLMKGVFLLLISTSGNICFCFEMKKVQADPGRGRRKFSPTPLHREPVCAEAHLRNLLAMFEAYTSDLILTALSNRDPGSISSIQVQSQGSAESDDNSLAPAINSVFSDMMRLRVSP